MTNEENTFAEWKAKRHLYAMTSYEKRTPTAFSLSIKAIDGLNELARQRNMSASDLLEALGNNLIHILPGPSDDFPNHD